MNSVNDSCLPRPVVQLRPVAEPDSEILFAIYASTRVEELAQVVWDAAQKESFLRGQFEAQRRFYLGEYPDADYRIVSVDGQSAGRFYVHQRADEIRLVDLALLPNYRGRGLGTALVTALLEQGERSARKVTLHVESFNPAHRLYKRLGFTRVASSGVYHLLEWNPSRSSADQTSTPPVPNV